MFWEVYSDQDGKRLNFQRILNKLQDSRLDHGERDAATALKFFSNDLSDPRALGYFNYKKSGKVLVMRKPAIIARQWRRLLEEHTEIAEAWEMSLDNGETWDSDSRGTRL